LFTLVLVLVSAVVTAAVTLVVTALAGAGAVGATANAPPSAELASNPHTATSGTPNRITSRIISPVSRDSSIPQNKTEYVCWRDFRSTHAASIVLFALD
jgi:hypothetical protein